jgi:hypothetical protein
MGGTRNEVDLVTADAGSLDLDVVDMACEVIAGDRLLIAVLLTPDRDVFLVRDSPQVMGEAADQYAIDEKLEPVADALAANGVPLPKYSYSHCEEEKKSSSRKQFLSPHTHFLPNLFPLHNSPS